jgi:microcystin-dependent protein
MPEFYLAEIRLFSFNFVPQGWALCNGQLLPINQNQALFSLLGTMYGGDGRVNFALPDLRGRIPMHEGGIPQGSRGGEQAHTVSIAEMPQHTHVANGTSAAATTVLPGGLLPANVGLNAYAGQGTATPLVPATIGNVGGSQAHLNMSPFLTLTFCIALQGIFPSRN